MVNKISYILKKILSLFKLAYKDFNRLFVHQYIAPKPTVINLNANDICNSMCVMCNIWQNQPQQELTPGELKNILKDSLFSKVNHVGITGGEPTLRDDIAELFEVCCTTLQNLQGLSIITNAINSNDVIDKIEKISSVCGQYKVSFSTMVSLDGIGHIHDRIRRSPGNFENANAVINYLAENSIPFSIGCTISKRNVWYVDEVLDFVQEKGYKARFRVAEFIKRLYNDNKTDEIRNFDEEEKYHLIGFFTKLIYNYEQDEDIKRTYRSIISILHNKKRLIGCPYQDRGIVLNSRGEIAYCAPKSDLFKPITGKSYKYIFTKNLHKRRMILHDHCDNCIHDYHAEITLKERLINFKEVIWEQLFKIKYTPILVIISRFIFVRKSKTILITGWYGTETTGDKAILGGICNKLKEKYPDFEIVISSIHPFVTEKTLSELKIEAKIVKVYSKSFIKAIKTSEKLIIGGGPLMDIEALSIPLSTFLIGKNAERIVWGCGIGPLKEEKFVKAVKLIFENSSKILLRDESSVKRAQEIINHPNIKFISDPAKDYIDYIKTSIKFKESGYLPCFIRELSSEYKGQLTDEEFSIKKINLERNIAIIIKKKAQELNLIPLFVPMHTFVIGGDDRCFYRSFTKEYFSDFKHEIYFKNSNVNKIVQIMMAAKFVICMRYHSVLFAHELGKDFIALDYTNGGKIPAYLKDNNALDKMVSFNLLTS